MIRYKKVTGTYKLSTTAKTIHTWTFPIAYTELYAIFSCINRGACRPESSSSVSEVYIGGVSWTGTTATVLYLLAIGKA